MYFHLTKIPAIQSPGWEWGWVASTPGEFFSYVIRDVDMPLAGTNASTVTTQQREP